jgi:hypothetical protein
MFLGVDPLLVAIICLVVAVVIWRLWPIGEDKKNGGPPLGPGASP